MSRTIRVAAAQDCSLATIHETLAALELTTKSAAQQGVGLLLFPEAYLGGYPRTCTFGSSIGARTELGRAQFQKYFESAVDLGDSPVGAGEAWHQRRLAVPPGAKFRGDGTREELERIAKETGVFLVVGIVERAGASLYCGAVYVSPEDGMLEVKRRKVMPTGTERLVWAQSSPSTLKAVRARIKSVEVVLGTAICWENYMPLLRYSLYAQGVELYLAPTADGRDTWLPLLQTIASEGRAFVVSCNQVVRQSELPDWVAGQKTGTVTGNGRRTGPPAVSRTLGRTRSSISTADGHEIVLPTVTSQSPDDDDVLLLDQGDNATSSHTETTASVPSNDPTDPEHDVTTSSRRRKSSIVKISDGHEVCLPLSKDAASRDPSTAPNPNSPSTAISEKPISNEQSNSDPLISRGGSCIVSPFGQVIAEPLWERKGLVIADVDLDECVRGKFDFDAVGHYSRSDVFKLSVNGLELCPP